MTAARALVALAAALIAALALASGASAATESVSITVEPAQVSTELGGEFSFETTLSNSAATDTVALVAHLNLLSLNGDAYVDPEDWSTQRTWYLGSIPAGEARTITWNVKAVDDGALAAYVTVVPQAGPEESPATSAVVEIVVAKKTTLNSGGILPLALGIPVLIGLLAGGVRFTRRSR